MNKGMISIIIPVYNSKEKLAECLESVATQDYEPLEVIVVDDCSTDGSLEICREYEKQYPFIHVYTKENEGVSAARNYGLSKAHGEYIQFADSDDMLYPNACKKLVSKMESDQSDVVICGYYNEKEARDVLYKNCIFLKKEDFLKEFPMLFSGFFIHVPWNKLYRRNAIERAVAEFPRDLNKGEDLLFNLHIFSNVECVSVLDEALYFYHNINDNSLSFRFREDAMEIEERLFMEVRRFWEENGGKNEPKFLYEFYLTAVKNKFYALLGKSGWDGKTCRNMIKKWAQMKSIRELCEKRNYFGKKDRMLLFMMKNKWSQALYLYYKKVAGK